MRKFTQLKFDLEALLEHLLAFQANGPNASLAFPAWYYQALWRGRAWCHLQTAWNRIAIDGIEYTTF